MGSITLRPTGAGSSTQHTPNTGTNWAAVDEEVADGAATYNRHTGDSSSGSIKLDMFTHGQTVPEGTNYVVTLHYNARISQAFLGTIAPAVKMNGTDRTFPGDSLTTNFAAYSVEFDTNPNTDEPLVAADFENLQIGYQTVVAVIGVTIDISQLYVIITYDSDDTEVEPASRAAALTQQTPSVVVGAALIPSIEDLALTGHAPSVQVSNNVRLTPDEAGLVLSGKGINLLFQGIVIPENSELVLTGLAPTPTLSDNQFPEPATASLNTIGQIPAITITFIRTLSRPGKLYSVIQTHLRNGFARRSRP